MKKISLLLTLVLMSSLFTSLVYGEEYNNQDGYDNQETYKLFTDVDNDVWYRESLEAIVDKEGISGYPDGSFKPQEDVTVEEFSKMLVMSLGIISYEYLEHSNAELEQERIDNSALQEIKGTWSEEFVLTCIDYGIINIDEFNSYKQTIKRGQMAAMIVRGLEKTQFKDYGQDNIETAIRLGLIKGYADGSIKEENSLSRAEAVVVLYRLINPLKRSPIVETRELTGGNYGKLNPEKVYKIGDTQYLYQYVNNELEVYEANDIMNWKKVSSLEISDSRFIKKIDDTVYIMDFINNKLYTSQDHKNFVEVGNLNIPYWSQDIDSAVLAKDVDDTYKLVINYNVTSNLQEYYVSVLYTSKDLLNYVKDASFTENYNNLLKQKVVNAFIANDILYYDMKLQYGLAYYDDLSTEDYFQSNAFYNLGDEDKINWLSTQTIIKDNLIFYNFIDNGKLYMTSDMDGTYQINLDYGIKYIYESNEGYFALTSNNDLTYSENLINWQLVAGNIGQTIGEMTSVIQKGSQVIVYGEKANMALTINSGETEAEPLISDFIVAKEGFTSYYVNGSYGYYGGNDFVSNIKVQASDMKTEITRWDGYLEDYLYLSDTKLTRSTTTEGSENFKYNEEILLQTPLKSGNSWETNFRGSLCDATIIEASAEEIQVLYLAQDSYDESFIVVYTKNLGATSTKSIDSWSWDGNETRLIRVYDVLSDEVVKDIEEAKIEKIRKDQVMKLLEEMQVGDYTELTKVFSGQSTNLSEALFAELDGESNPESFDINVFNDIDTFLASTIKDGLDFKYYGEIDNNLEIDEIDGIYVFTTGAVLDEERYFYLLFDITLSGDDLVVSEIVSIEFLEGEL